MNELENEFDFENEYFYNPIEFGNLTKSHSGYQIYHLSERFFVYIYKEGITVYDINMKCMLNMLTNINNIAACAFTKDKFYIMTVSDYILTYIIGEDKFVSSDVIKLKNKDILNSNSSNCLLYVNEENGDFWILHRYLMGYIIIIDKSGITKKILYENSIDKFTEPTSITFDYKRKLIFMSIDDVKYLRIYDYDGNYKYNTHVSNQTHIQGLYYDNEDDSLYLSNKMNEEFLFKYHDFKFMGNIKLGKSMIARMTIINKDTGFMILLNALDDKNFRVLINKSTMLMSLLICYKLDLFKFHANLNAELKNTKSFFDMTIKLPIELVMKIIKVVYGIRRKYIKQNGIKHVLKIVLLE